MTIKQRLIKLESSLPSNQMVVHIIRTIIDPNAPTPIGYSYGDIKILKIPDESKEVFDGRLFDAAPIGDVNNIGDIDRHIFWPIYADDDNVII